MILRQTFMTAGLMASLMAVASVRANAEPLQTTAPAAETAPASPGRVEPKEFIRQAYLANEFGIAASQVVLQNAQSPAAKSTAQKILNDGMQERQAMIQAIQTAASDMHFDQSWDDQYKQRLADLKSSSATTFDQKYLATETDVTQQSASLFASYAQLGTDPAVKRFAAQILPSLQAESAELKSAG